MIYASHWWSFIYTITQSLDCLVLKIEKPLIEQK